MRRLVLVFPLCAVLSGCPALLSDAFVVDKDASVNRDASTRPSGDTGDDATLVDDAHDSSETAAFPQVSEDSALVEPGDANASCDGGVTGCGADCVDVQNDPKNCGACGAQCNTTTGSPSCAAATCSYACNPGRSDCNAGTAPNVDGCECSTAVCCGSSCQTIHSNGVGQSFYDCVPYGTYNQVQAQEACQAIGPGQPCYTLDCSAGTDGGTGVVVCSNAVPAASQADCICWAYGGALAGRVHDAQSSACVCPGSADPLWDKPGTCSVSKCAPCIPVYQSSCCKADGTCGCRSNFGGNGGCN